MHFAGEHASQANQSYMESGVETGYRTAGETLDDLK